VNPSPCKPTNIAASRLPAFFDNTGNFSVFSDPSFPSGSHPISTTPPPCSCPSHALPPSVRSLLPEEIPISHWPRPSFPAGNLSGFFPLTLQLLPFVHTSISPTHAGFLTSTCPNSPTPFLTPLSCFFPFLYLCELSQRNPSQATVFVPPRELKLGPLSIVFFSLLFLPWVLFSFFFFRSSKSASRSNGLKSWLDCTFNDITLVFLMSFRVGGPDPPGFSGFVPPPRAFPLNCWFVPPLRLYPRSSGPLFWIQ